MIASKGTPWSRVTEIDCGLWVDNDAAALASAIRQAQAMPLREMGRRGREWMERDYSWRTIGNEMASNYKALIKANSKARPVSSE